MEIIQHYDGIGGEFIEFQVTLRPSDLKTVDHWQEDSIFLRATKDIPFAIIDKHLGDGWWLAFNTIDHAQTMALAKDLSGDKDLKKLVDWIIQHSKEGTYLNVLGV